MTEKDKAQKDKAQAAAAKDWKRGAMPLDALLPPLLDPIYARKGLASSALIAAWPDLVGTAFAECSMVETIQWPMQRGNGAPSFQSGVLVVRVDGPKALYLQHEEHQILQRINQFLGFPALARLKLIQAPIYRKEKQKPAPLPPLSAAQDEKLRHYIPRFDDPKLDQAMLAMGRAVLQRTLIGR